MSQDSRTIKLLHKLARTSGVTGELGPGRVAIALEGEQAEEAQAQLIITFAVNLAARLFPVVRSLDILVPAHVKLTARLPRWSKLGLQDSVGQFLTELKPPVKWAFQTRLSVSSYDSILSIGGSSAIPATIFAGGSGWLSRLSTATPAIVHGPTNPVGAYATAAFAVAEIWKQLLARYAHLFPSIPIRPLIGDFAFSSLSYRHDDLGPNPALPEHITLDPLSLIGAGAGGAAAAYTLASCPRLSLDITAIEPDEVTDTNLNRLVPATFEDAERARPKVDVVKDLFQEHAGVNVRALKYPFDIARNELAVADFRHIVAAVHSRSARRSIQLETPEVLWDAAATETGEFFVWRTDFGKTPCMGCRLKPEQADPELAKARQLAKLMGFSKTDWLRKIRDNEPFTDVDIERLRSSRSGSPGFDLPAVGERFGDWEASQCGKLDLPDPDDEIPIPFAPVLAGVLVAGEVIKHQLFPELVLNSYYWNTLVGAFMTRNTPKSLMPKPDCAICTKPALRAQCARRWGL